ncbi:MAG TPA: helix-turn-helix domain-containing protein [Candidatus Angelobacter sp.]|nr:helix-turn-helix domain-containing protein [Candidatus Angelobacter sp.]HKT51379.1 helix-turn-helix domain-containing protein [Candidatus Angelobacter sp.]
MIHVTVLILDGTFSSTAVGPMEVFRHAGMLWNFLTGTRPAPRFSVITASSDGRAVRCDGPICLQPDAALKDIRKTDLIFVPTTGISLDDAVERNSAIVPWLRQWHKRGAEIAAVCSGVELVAAAGLLDGKRATTHWALAERLRAKYPKVKWVPELMVTEDRGFYCGGGVHAALDLSLYLVEKFCGHEVALQGAKAMLIETPRAWQAGFAIVPLKTAHKDDAVSEAQEWLHQNFQCSFPLEATARRVGMSVRNFVRRFKQATGDSPLIYLQKLRIAAAKRLLEGKHRSIQEISDAVGYEDVAFFRNLFQRHTGVSPSAYREKFGV